MSGLCEFEVLVLRHLNGEDIPNLQWGAAMGAAIEFLSGSGYITHGGYKITDKGRRYLAACTRYAIALEEWPPEEPCIHQRVQIGEEYGYCPDCGQYGRWPFSEVGHHDH